MLHEFNEKDGFSGDNYSMMAWVKCFNSGGSWASIWHLSSKNANTPRNPALFLNMGGRYIHACFTNKAGTNVNLNYNSSYRITWNTWYHIT